jgi:hypothetical protein
MECKHIDLDATTAVFAPLKTPAEIERANDFVLQHPHKRFAGLQLVN